MSIAEEKQNFRLALPESDLTAGDFGRLAERLRGSRHYSQCRRLYVGPDPTLLQIRINTLLDQKELIMPTPGLKQGFIRFRPNRIPFPKLGHAVTFKGMFEHGEVLATSELAGLGIDLLVGSVEAAGRDGSCLGDGTGFFDLATAILNECGALDSKADVIGVVAGNRIFDTLPMAEWDVRLSTIVSLEGELHPGGGEGRRAVQWDELPKKRVKKIQPLWDLFCQRSALG